ncbi:MAG: tetratricopeptide repeat protein [Leptospirales bacterium]|nr:tetratricopeptide repeat protein [Leptospirales bacterium]
MNTNSMPAEAIAIYNRALEMTNSGELQSAISEYQKAINLYPHFVEAYNNMGEIYSIMGKNELAISTYNKALAIERNYRILLNLGVEYYNNGIFKTALGYFIDSLIQKPDFHEGNYYAGLTHYNLKNYNEAEKYLRNVIAVDRKHIKANYMLSYIYYEKKDYNQVVECLDSIREIADDKSFINRYYGFCCFHLGRYNEAVKYLKDAISLHPEYNKFKNYLESLTYENKVKEIGDVDSAIMNLENLMMKESLNMKDITRLSMLYVFKGENQKAEKMITDYKNNIVAKKYIVA